MTRRRIIKILVLAASLVAVVAAGAIYISRSYRQSAIDAATTWGRLAPLPPSAQNVQVEVNGSMFTREFVITFDAAPAVIQQWIAASPGPSSATTSTAGSITTYAIKPGGGAQFAEVKVDSSTNRVVIRTHWS
jgi:hypothetical protein